MANDKTEYDGVVIEHNRNQWIVELPTGHQVKCHLKGRMRQNHIRVIVGDNVRVEINPYDLSTGIISFRYQGKPEKPDPTS